MPAHNQDEELMRRALEISADCPPLDHLIQAERTEQIEAHLAECAHCKNELSLYHEFEAVEIRPEEAADLRWVAAETARKVKKELDPTPWWKLIFSAKFSPQVSVGMAALLVVAAGTLMTRSTHPTSFPEDISNESTLRSTNIQLVEPVEDINFVPSLFRWVKLTNSSMYRVIVFEVDHTELWTENTASLELVIPDSIKKQFLPGKTLLWKVIAYDLSGKQLADSETRKFRVTVP